MMGCLNLSKAIDSDYDYRDHSIGEGGYEQRHGTLQSLRMPEFRPLREAAKSDEMWWPS